MTTPSPNLASNDFLRKRVEALELEKEKNVYNQGKKHERSKAKTTAERRKKLELSKLERKRAGSGSKRAGSGSKKG